MLFFDGSPECQRVQCAFISTDEVADMCRELSDEYILSEETLLPDGLDAEYQKPRLMEETWRMIQRLPDLDELPVTYGCSKLLDITEWSVLQQLREIGAVDRYSKKVLMHDMGEILRRASEIFA